MEDATTTAVAASSGGFLLWALLLVIPIILVFALTKFIKKQYPEEKHQDGSDLDITKVAEPEKRPEILNKDELSD